MDDESTDDETERSEQEATEEPPPFQDLVERIRASDDEDAISALEISSDVDAADFFEEETTEQFDTEALWSAIESDWREVGDSSDFQEDEPDHVVPKQWYCEQCEHFSEPPDVHCLHDGTTILEFVGTEDVRVQNCPVVAERKALGQFQPD